MNTLRNSSSLRNTKAAVVGLSIALIGLSSAYFHKEFQEEKVVAYVTKPYEAIQVEDNYYTDLNYGENLEVEESSLRFSR